MLIRAPRLFLPALALCLAASPAAHAQDPVDDLAQLIEAAAVSAEPTTSFFSGFSQLGDFDLNEAGIKEAMVKATVAPDGPLTPMIGKATRITKRGGHLDFRRSASSTLALPDGAIQMSKRVQFNLESGFVGALNSDAMARLIDARGTYYHLKDISGIQVRADGGGFYNLYEMYLAEEADGQAVAHVKAGNWLKKEWLRIPLPSDTRTAAPSEEPTRVDVAARPEDGLPLPRVNSDLLDEIKDEDLTELAELNSTPEVRTFIDETPILDAESGVTAIEPAPAVNERQGMLDILDTAQAIEEASQIEEPAAQIEEPAAQIEEPAAQIEEPAAQIEEPAAQIEEPAAQIEEPAAQIEEPASAEDKERIDAEAEETKSDLDALGTKLDELVALIREDQKKAEERIMAHIKELEASNESLEIRLAALTARLDDPSRSMPADEWDRIRRDSDRYRRGGGSTGANDRDRDRDRYGDRVDGPRDYRDGNLDRRNRDDRSRDGGLDRRNTRNSDGSFPISDANGRPVDANGRPIVEDTSKMNVIQRLLLKLLDGIEKGLQRKYANETNRNLNNRAALMAGNNPRNNSYANYAMGNAVANSNLGTTLGVKANSAGTLAYPNAMGNPASHVLIQPANSGYRSPSYATPTYSNPVGQPTYRQPTYTYGAPVSGPSIGGPASTPTNGAYVVPITKAP